MSRLWKVPAMYVLYWFGHFLSRVPMNWTKKQATHDRFYVLYNWCMCASSDLDEWNILWTDAPNE